VLAPRRAVNIAASPAGMVAHAMKTCRVDPRRVCVTGLSMGGGDTTVVPATSQAWVDKINKLSIADGYACASAANPTAKLTLYPGLGHDSWTVTYDPTRSVEAGKNLYEWMLVTSDPQAHCGPCAAPVPQ
jgi:hypothetical protein